MLILHATHRLNSSTKLLAIKADEDKALHFLEDLGFTGLKLKSDEEDMIKFFYTSYDKPILTHFLGQPKPSESSIRYDFGTQGVIAIWPNNKTVVLKNAKSITKLTPTETHVPIEIEKQHIPEFKTWRLGEKEPEKKIEPDAEIPVVSPNTPGSKENDDSHVPVVYVSAELDREYLLVQKHDSPMARLLFNKQLWMWLNVHKFAGRMKPPKFVLLKNQGANAMRLRGRWWPSKRVLEVAPRLYNATFNFFIEIFLHEMCHQAVSEIDCVNETVNKGHGPHWAAWMTHVGLNPRRFDPNDNVTYMTEKEKTEDKEKKDAKQTLIDNLGLVKMMPMANTAATLIRKGKALRGLIVCVTPKKIKGYALWAFLSEEQFTEATHGSVAWERAYSFEFYKWYGPDTMKVYEPAWQGIANKIKAYIAADKARKSFNLG